MPVLTRDIAKSIVCILKKSSKSLRHVGASKAIRSLDHYAVCAAYAWIGRQYWKHTIGSGGFTGFPKKVSCCPIWFLANTHNNLTEIMSRWENSRLGMHSAFSNKTQHAGVTLCGGPDGETWQKAVLLKKNPKWICNHRNHPFPHTPTKNYVQSFKVLNE